MFRVNKTIIRITDTDSGITTCVEVAPAVDEMLGVTISLNYIIEVFAPLDAK